MCDTLVAVGEATADGTVILAKNSDRHPNEAQVLVHLPRAQHEPGTMLRCTDIEIPQVRETREVLLSKIFWAWGCEMAIVSDMLSLGTGDNAARAAFAVFCDQTRDLKAGR